MDFRVALLLAMTTYILVDGGGGVKSEGGLDGGASGGLPGFQGVLFRMY